MAIAAQIAYLQTQISPALHNSQVAASKAVANGISNTINSIGNTYNNIKQSVATALNGSQTVTQKTSSTAIPFVNETKSQTINLSQKSTNSSSKPNGWRYMPPNPWESPGPDWEAKPGSIKDVNQRPYKDWYNPKTDEWAHPDFSHGEPNGPHWDITSPDGSQSRVDPGGSVPKPK